MQIKVMTHVCGEDKIFVSRHLYEKMTSSGIMSGEIIEQGMRLLVDDMLPPEWIVIPDAEFYKASREVQMQKLQSFMQAYRPAD